MKWAFARHVFHHLDMVRDDYRFCWCSAGEPGLNFRTLQSPHHFAEHCMAAVGKKDLGKLLANNGVSIDSIIQAITIHYHDTVMGESDEV